MIRTNGISSLSNHFNSTAQKAKLKKTLKMAFKFVTFCGLIAVASAGLLPATQYVSAPQHQQAYITKEIQPAIIKKYVQQQEHYEPANYEFHYDVQDAHTGDYHSQQEKAENGAVRGSYQLHDADGYLRIVEYTADDHNGFQAVVKREPLSQKYEQPAVIKKIYAQPAVAKIAIQQPAYVTKTIQVPVEPQYVTKTIKVPIHQENNYKQYNYQHQY